jgi:hypothetical protein
VKYPRLAVLAFVILIPVICHAKTTCPWINDATAFGVLGGTANSPMGLSEVGPTSCSFTYKDAAISHELRITIEQPKDAVQTYNAYKTQCGPGMNPLPAIGNEAVICAANMKGHALGEQVIGRVRDSVFTISVSTDVENDPSMSKEALEQKVKLVAEQVSGNLF